MTIDEVNWPSAKLRGETILCLQIKSRRSKTRSEPRDQRIKADAVKDRLKKKLRANRRRELEALVRQMKSNS